DLVAISKAMGHLVKTEAIGIDDVVLARGELMGEAVEEAAVGAAEFDEMEMTRRGVPADEPDEEVFGEAAGELRGGEGLLVIAVPVGAFGCRRGGCRRRMVHWRSSSVLLREKMNSRRTANLAMKIRLSAMSLAAKMLTGAYS